MPNPRSPAESNLVGELDFGKPSPAVDPPPSELVPSELDCAKPSPTVEPPPGELVPSELDCAKPSPRVEPPSGELVPSELDCAKPSPTVEPPSGELVEPEPAKSRLVGRVFATEQYPSTPDTFYFWTEWDSPVGIGTIVRVTVPQPSQRQFYKRADYWHIYGIVTEAQGYTDLVSALYDYIGSDQNPHLADAAPTKRPEIRTFKAAVLRMEPEEPMQPVPIGPVYLAADEDVLVSLRMKEYVDKGRGIPVGVYVKGGRQSPVYLDADFLLGPEAAHLNITGVSGLATKTSLVEFLLKSIFTHYYPDRADKGVAAVFFNVKGPDLLYLDIPPKDGLSAEELEIYAKLGIPPTPFENVYYYAPYKPDGINLNTLRTHAELMHNVYPLRWGLKEIFEYTEVLLNRDDIDAKADALLSLIEEKVINHPDVRYTEGVKVTDFVKLEEWFQRVIESLQADNKKEWYSHHLATIYKVRNRLINITNRCKGLVGNDEEVSDLPWGNFRKNTIYVIDVANLEPAAQDLIFTRVVSKIRELLELNALGVERVIIFVDELNKYAGTDTGDTYLRRTLLDIAERGRYLGEVLFSAQQFRSQVHKRIVGNCGTALYGRMDMDELSTPGYSTLSAAVKTKLATLPKGELMIRHPHFTQPVFVKFPRPPVMTGNDGRMLYPPQESLSFAEAIVCRLHKLDPSLCPHKIKDIIAGIDAELVLKQVNTIERTRPKDILGMLKNSLKTVPVRPINSNPHKVPVKPIVFDDDPYGD
ncbi:MAG: ATP-binding protein [Pseudanabaenaceae cyanobacterium SKYGB_i_bin29]|nr:ATP-binding protein [Pseudanabaenaceae cyanobacterium SKYG29]MDW8421989.1 ATP-binding protein [Pseudanabaenaceae cyanobacterium SKYGB_i_bin29]